MDPVQRFVTNLFAAFSKPPRRETAEFFFQRLMRWRLTETQWARACSLIVSEMDKFPTLSQIYPYLVRAERGSGDEVVPVWRTWRDSDGRWWAQDTRARRSLRPGVHEIEEWKREAVPFEEGRAIFLAAMRSAWTGPPVGDVVNRYGPRHQRRTDTVMAHAGQGNLLVAATQERADYDDSEAES